MLPDLRFAIGAVLASALLIVAAFGLAATVRVAHHQSATPDDPWHTLSFNDPTDWGLLAERARPTTAAKTEPPDVPPGDLAATTPDPGFNGAIDPAKREPPGGAVATVVPPAATEPTPDPDVIAAIPPTPPAQSTQTPSIAAPSTSPNITAPSMEDEPLEPSERVRVLPGFPTAGPGFVPLPLEHPIALPVPDPRGKGAAKQATKKKTARRRYRFAPWPPIANTGYSATGFPEMKFPTTNNEKKWTTLGE
jgi:hypothetical protein